MLCLCYFLIAVLVVVVVSLLVFSCRALLNGTYLRATETFSIIFSRSNGGKPIESFFKIILFLFYITF